MGKGQGVSPPKISPHFEERSGKALTRFSLPQEGKPRTTRLFGFWGEKDHRKRMPSSLALLLQCWSAKRIFLSHFPRQSVATGYADAEGLD